MAVGAVGFERLHRRDRPVRGPDLQPAQAAVAQAASARGVRRGPALAERRRLSGLATVRRARHRLSLASRTMLLDLERRRLGTGAAGCVRDPDRPAPADAGQRHQLGPLLPEAAAATGLPADCVVGVGGHDHVCGLIAAGADRPGVLLDSLGTAEALSLVSSAPLTDPALGWDGFNQGAIDVGRPLYYVFGGLPTAAAAVEWFRGLHGGVDHATLIAEAEAAAAGSNACCSCRICAWARRRSRIRSGAARSSACPPTTGRGDDVPRGAGGYGAGCGQHAATRCWAIWVAGRPSGSWPSAAAPATSC